MDRGPATLVAALLRAVPALAGAPERPGTTLVGIDGWSGAGKTSLAGSLADGTGAVVVSVEDLLPGWEGLAVAVRLLTRLVLRPLAEGRPAIWPQWDWGAERWESLRRLAPGGLVLVEGCGTGAAVCRPWLDALIWVDAPPAQRRSRLEARADWATYRPWVEVWAAQERALRQGDDPSSLADAVVRWSDDLAVVHRGPIQAGAANDARVAAPVPGAEGTERRPGREAGATRPSEDHT